MTTPDLRKRLHSYIDIAKEKKLRAIYAMIEEEFEEYHHWDDQNFVKEINKRLNDLETGKVKATSWQDVKGKSAKAVKTRK